MNQENYSDASLIMLAIEKYNNGFRGLKDNSTRGRYF